MTERDEKVEGGRFNSPVAVSSSPSLSVVTESDSLPPPLPTQEKTIQLQLENEVEDETTIESNGRLRRTSSDVSSLEAAGVRELGKYDEVYHREREGISLQQEGENHDQPSEGDLGGDDLYDHISLVRSTSEDTSEILSAMISKEIEEQAQSDVPKSEQGSAEIDCNSIPFETYAVNMMTECRDVHDEYGQSSKCSGEQTPINPFDLVDDTGDVDVGEGEGNAASMISSDDAQVSEAVAAVDQEDVAAPPQTEQQSQKLELQESEHHTHKKHHGGVKHGKGKHSRIHHNDHYHEDNVTETD